MQVGPEHLLGLGHHRRHTGADNKGLVLNAFRGFCCLLCPVRYLKEEVVADPAGSFLILTEWNIVGECVRNAEGMAALDVGKSEGALGKKAS